MTALFHRRLHRITFWLLLLPAFVLLPRAASAHPFPPDITVAQLKIHYKLINMTLRGPASELVEPAGVAPADLVGEETKKPVLDKLKATLLKNFTLMKDGKVLDPEIVSADYQNAAQANFAGYTLEVHYPTDKPAEQLKVESKFVHSIISSGGVQFDLRADKETARTFSTQANLGSVWNNIVDFTQMGMEHLFTGPDHILFICTLIFAVMSFKSVVKMLTGFTVGHSITLILSTFNVIHVSGRIADIFIALTIVYVGLENIFTKEMPKNRWWIVFVFGLVHGMGFSQSLKEVGLPEQGLVLCLLGFNLGIELAQIIIVAVVYPVLSRIRWYREAWDHANGTRQFKQLMNYGSAFTACMGFYWFFERITGH